MKFDRDSLIRYMEQRFFTYADLAERVGVAPQTVYRWVSGRSVPTKRNIVKMAKALGVEPWQLMEEE